MSVIAFDPFFPTSYRVLTTEDRGKNNRNISVTGTHTWSRSKKNSIIFFWPKNEKFWIAPPKIYTKDSTGKIVMCQNMQMRLSGDTPKITNFQVLKKNALRLWQKIRRSMGNVLGGPKFMPSIHGVIYDKNMPQLRYLPRWGRQKKKEFKI